MLEVGNNTDKEKKTLSPKRKRKRKNKMRKKQKPIPSSIVRAPRWFLRRKMIESGSIINNRKVRLEKSLPVIFSFNEDKESVLKFLNETFDYYKLWKSRLLEKRYNYDLTAVTSIDITAICLFLSLINKRHRLRLT